ncbi:MAG: hypothetical protein OXT67_13050 [Zetaproteobacteria bacterium]|nr:hypothetical protein [Zetaproteobacteria bacterium]
MFTPLMLLSLSFTPVVKPVRPTSSNHCLVRESVPQVCTRPSLVGKSSLFLGSTYLRRTSPASTSSCTVQMQRKNFDLPLRWAAQEDLGEDRVIPFKYENAADGCRLIGVVSQYHAVDKEDKIRFYKRKYRDDGSAKVFYRLVGRRHGYPLRKIRQDQQHMRLAGAAIGATEFAAGMLILSGFIPHKFVEWSKHPDDVYLAATNLGLFSLLTDKLISRVLASGPQVHNPFYYFAIAGCLPLDRILQRQENRFWVHSVHDFIEKKLVPLLKIDHRDIYCEQVELDAATTCDDWIAELQHAMLQVERVQQQEKCPLPPPTQVHFHYHLSHPGHAETWHAAHQATVEDLRAQGWSVLANQVETALRDHHGKPPQCDDSAHRS